MAVRAPLVMVNGRMSPAPAGDTIPVSNLSLMSASSAGAAPAGGQGVNTFLNSNGTFTVPAVEAIDTRFYFANLAADLGSTLATTVKVTGLDEPLPIGTYQFKYYVRYQAAAITTGIKMSVNFTGTNSFFIANLRWVDVLAANASGGASQANVQAGGAVVGAFSARVKSTAGWGTTISVDVAAADMLMIVEGTFQSTAVGNLELWFASEVAGAGVTIKAGSNLVVTKVG